MATPRPERIWRCGPPARRLDLGPLGVIRVEVAEAIAALVGQSERPAGGRRWSLGPVQPGEARRRVRRRGGQADRAGYRGGRATSSSLSALPSLDRVRLQNKVQSRE